MSENFINILVNAVAYNYKLININSIIYAEIKINAMEQLFR